MLALPYITNAYLETFMFVLLRFTGMIVASPIFGRRNVPVLLKMGLCVILSSIMMNILPARAEMQSTDIYTLAFNAIKELLFGIILGYLAILVFSIAIAAGQIIDMQIGFGLSNFFDPQLGVQVSSTGSLFNILVLLVFFVVDAHHMLIRIMFDSFSIVEPGKVVLGTSIVEGIVQFFLMFFVLVIKVSMPIIAVEIVTEAMLGFIVRTIPQMNVFMVGIPLKIFIGLVVLMLFIPAFVLFLNGVFDELFIWQNKIVQGMVSN